MCFSAHSRSFKVTQDTIKTSLTADSKLVLNSNHIDPLFGHVLLTMYFIPKKKKSLEEDKLLFKHIHDVLAILFSTTN